MKYYYIFFLILILTGVLTYKISLSYFSDTGQSTDNILSASETFPTIAPTNTPTPSPTPTVEPSDVVINEVFNASQNKDEWVELYNRTTFSINVSGWKISDKNAYDTGQDDTFPTVSPIPPGGFAVIITNNSEVAGIPTSAIIIELTSANIGSGLNQDGDAVILKNASNTIIDAMNYGNVSVIFPSPPAAPPAGQTVARNPNGVDTNTASDWIIDSTPSLGVSN